MEGCILLTCVIACVVVFGSLVSYPKAGDKDEEEPDRI